MLAPKVYTPEQAAEILQLSKSTIYDLISRGEIIAKKIGGVYRITQKSLSFVFSGLDEDILELQEKDEKNLRKKNLAIGETRKKIWQKTSSF